MQFTLNFPITLEVISLLIKIVDTFSIRVRKKHGHARSVEMKNMQ
jgi:hypothetical protein